MEMVVDSTIPYSRVLTAANPSQRGSLAEKKRTTRYCRYFDLSLDNRKPYFDVNCMPITVKAEDEMEMLSDLITVGELYTPNFLPGIYLCSRCQSPLFNSKDKWKGPCVWPSFRKGMHETALFMPEVLNYNDYQCKVSEVYCTSCELFLGHRFEDGVSKGDTHVQARWRF